jgi:hypothetical protein
MRADTAIVQRSGILDNLDRGSVGDFLREKLENGSELSIVSAYFTIYAYAALQAELDAIGGLRFLFGEPRFIRSIDPKQMLYKLYGLTDTEITLIEPDGRGGRGGRGGGPKRRRIKSSNCLIE